jgi:hypothetical protein
VAAGTVLASPAVLRASHAQGGKGGVALVIGNSKYQWEAALPNVKRDAPDVAKRFQALGLQTELVEDGGRAAMDQALAKFKSAAKGANFAAFYFAGHGASWEKSMYLVPVDADLSNPETVKTLIPGPTIGLSMKAAANHLVVYDNCRNNPADGWRQLEAERAAQFNPEQARGSGGGGGPNWLVLFSTAPGRIARDGPPGQNSPFAASLLRQMNDASVDLQSLPSRLRRDLLIATQGRQVLWDRNSYAAPFSINGSPRPGSAADGAGGWGGDPAKIIELPKAYAWAHENGLPLPSGLIAHRPSNPADAAKVGSFHYMAQSPIGVVPQLMIVMSVEDQQTAEIIVAGKGRYNQKLAKGEAGSYWRFTTARLNGSRLEYVPRDSASRFIYSWSDANSGHLTMLNESQVGSKGNASYNAPFTRLDG